MKKNWFQIALGIVVLGAIMVVASGCAAPVAGAANGSEEPRVIIVAGQGESTAEPDIAYVELGIAVSKGDLGEAMAEANEVMADVQAAVLELGIAEEDLQTSNFNVWTEEIRSEETRELTGQVIYHVRNMLTIKVKDIASTDDVIGAALDAGATEVNGLRFGIDDTDALEEEARAAAVDDARARAQQLADALGVELGAPVRVSESFWGGEPIIRAEYDMAAMEAPLGTGASLPPISTGELTVSISVDVQFELIP